MSIIDLEKLKIEIEKNHEANVAAIDRLLRKTREIASRATPFIQARYPRKRPSEIVERIIKNFAGDFNISSICRKYKDETGKPPTSNIRLLVSQAINKLRHRNPPEIIEVKKGEGSRSGIYKMRTN